MVMEAEPVWRCYEAICSEAGEKVRVIHLTPQGRVFNQTMAREYAETETLAFLCGHYEGIDERVLEEIGTDENTVVIWSARRHFANALKERLDQEGITWCAYTGDETTEQKEAAAEAFSTGKARVCIANQASAGYGVNFMKDCSYAIYACCNSSVEQDEQSKSRLLRGELKEPKYCYRIIADGSMEEKVINALDLGRELLGDENRKEMFTLREEK